MKPLQLCTSAFSVNYHIQSCNGVQLKSGCIDTTTGVCQSCVTTVSLNDDANVAKCS